MKKYKKSKVSEEEERKKKESYQVTQSKHLYTLSILPHFFDTIRTVLKKTRSK